MILKNNCLHNILRVFLTFQEVCIVVFESTVYEVFRQEFESRTGAVGGEYLQSKKIMHLE